MRHFAASLPVRRKVALAFAVILLVAMGPSVAALWGLSAVHQAAVEVRAGWLPAARLLGEVGRAYARLRITDTRIAVSADPAILARGRQIATGNLDVLERSLRAYDLLPLPAAERQAVAARAAVMTDYMDARARVARFADAGNWTAATELWFGEANRLFRAYNDLLDASIARMAELAETATERGESIYRASLWLLLGGAVAAVVAAVGTGLALVYLIAGPVARMAERLRRLAEGDMSVDIRETIRADEVGDMGRALGVFRHNAVQVIRREAELQSANARFDTALGNMSQGLCMYDGAGQLAVVNARYCEIFGLPPDEVRLGSTRRDAIELRAAYGHHGGASVDDIFERSGGALVRREAGTWTVEASGGRTVEVSYRPMAGGGWVTTFDDVTERRRAEEQVVFLARHDALTRLPNRVLFQERVEQALAQAGRGAAAAVLCLDLDRFKEVNDTLGHPVGDMLLRAVAERLLGVVREVDMVARLGGDEFAVVQAGLERLEDAGRLAHRIVDALGAPYELDGRRVVIGASVGVALAPTDGAHFDKLLKSADMALCRAKLDGQGGFRFFEPEMDAQSQARRELEQDMRGALANGEFELFYQPLVNLERDEISGFEALMRWRHPTRGTVSPAQFIPVAEETGLIVPLGEWALRRACAEAARWPGTVKIAVNLSPVQFKGRALVETVMEALAASGLPGCRLELEITESIMLQDSKATLATLHALRGLGVRIAMDDFGTGYSSLSYLRSFPFDKIKIDQSFIRDLGNNEGSTAIVRAVTGLGASLGMATTAEGVETHEQLAQLRAHRCTEVQGYLFSPPCPAGDVAPLLQRSRQASWLDRPKAGPMLETAR